MSTRSLHPEIQNIISQIQQFKNNQLVMAKYNIKAHKKHTLLENSDFIVVDEYLETIMKNIEENNKLLEDLLIQLHEKGSASPKQ